MEQGRRIVFFDGVCNLCNRLVRFILKHDGSRSILFAPLQSPTGKEILQSLSSKQVNSDTVIYAAGGQVYLKSEAILRIFLDMGGIWKAFYGLRFLPLSFRDRVYDLIARNRYRIFGKMDNCMIPTSEESIRFIL